jgi:outer membrane receptor protein involved in Fe transport
MEFSVRNIFAFFLIFFGLTGLAQAQNGTIYGKIRDKSNQNPIETATAFVQGTSFGALTDADGVFVIEVPAGTYTVIVKLMEYKDLVITDVVVAAGEKTMVEGAMEVFGSTMDTVKITSSVQKNSNVGVLQFRKLEVGMVVGVSSADIARSPDRNTGQVLRRISGASIQDNKFVVIRGLSDRYNVAQVNGMALPSTEPDRRAFSFDIFPAGMLDNLIIQKTATPDLPGNFAGGVIQLNTRDIPETSFLNVSASSAYNTQSTFRPYTTYEGSRRDWLGNGGQDRELPSDIPGTAEYQAALDDPETKYQASQLMPNDWGMQQKNSMSPGMNFNVGMGNHKQIGRSNFGFVLGGLYQHQRRLVVSERGDFNLDTTRIFSFVDKQYREDAQMGGLLNLAYNYDSTQSISVKAMYNQTGEDLFVDREGVDYLNAQNVRATSMQYTGTNLLSGQVGGIHKLGKHGLELRWGGTYSKLKRTVPNMRRMYYFQNIGDTVFQAFVPLGAPSPNYAGKYYGSLDEGLAGADLNVAMPYHLGGLDQKVHGGFSSQFRNRDFSARVFGYVIARPFSFDWNRLYEGQDSIFDGDAIGADGFRLEESTNTSDSYTAGSKLIAGYVLSDNHLSHRLRAVWGLRVEQFQQQLNTITYGGDTVALDTTTVDFLPSINLSWEMSKNTFLRLAASRTVSRPEFRELAPFSYYDFNTSSSVYGNDTLVRSHILNLDARFEIYPRAGQLISGTVFYKQFKNPIEQVIDASSGFGSRIYTYQNVPSATNFGAELEVRLKANGIDSLIHWNGWDKITWFANLSYIRSQVNLSGVASQIGSDSTRALQGQSPYLINTGLQYFDVVHGFSFSVLFNRIGRRIFQVGSNGFLDIYEAPRSVLDFQIALRVFRNGEIKLNYSDIINQKNVFYQDQNANGKFDQSVDTQFYGNRFGSNLSLGFGLNF